MIDIYAEHELCEHLVPGYRLVRRSRKTGQPAVVSHGHLGCELGFESFAMQDQVMGKTRDLHAQGKYVVVIGHTNRHVFYDLADEYWRVLLWAGDNILGYHT